MPTLREGFMKDAQILSEMLAEFFVMCAKFGISKEQVNKNVCYALEVVSDDEWEIMTESLQSGEDDEELFEIEPLVLPVRPADYVGFEGPWMEEYDEILKNIEPIKLPVGYPELYDD